jgi:hypothetical protein
MQRIIFDLSPARLKNRGCFFSNSVYVKFFVIGSWKFKVNALARGRLLTKIHYRELYHTSEMQISLRYDMQIQNLEVEEHVELEFAEARVWGRQGHEPTYLYM